ncbi:LysM domain-containing protein [Burkholderia diffusa]|uniref:peptidoglycan DD-metalloendopeptidase family protein n=1 Tax=Burkholderia diffusa TaxID=488732 RepID=UPI001CB364E7|nr:peptidoglycan DD-metalloendopeptidase family protein [Burkholderia diffusa]CAG9257189.1 LysM domain-containing protein [Burkholderia diffusa]
MQIHKSIVHLPLAQLVATVCLLGALFSVGGCTSMPWKMSQSDNVAISPMTVPPGYYRVNPGDNIDSIAVGFHLPPDDVIRWNGLANPAAIVPGQLLRVVPPVMQSEHDAPDHDNAVSVTPEAASPPSLIWPVQGPVVKPFVAGKSFGILIGGDRGGPVNAAAAGRVVYAGTSIAAYGPLVIIKHEDGLITAYGYNGKLLVKENEAVKQGQVIAEIGRGKHGRSVLLFEVRRNGEKIDPLSVLPARPNQTPD